MKYFYDSQFYENRALQHLASQVGKEVVVNYRVPDFSLPLSRRYELDGIFPNGDKILVAEVKSFPVSEAEVERIVLKYDKLGFKDIIIVCPKIDGQGKALKRKGVEVVEFNIDPKEVTDYYRTVSLNISNLMGAELGTGWHNFRFRLLFRSPNVSSLYLNQVDKKIDNTHKLLKEIERRIPKNNPPIKVLWSVNRWLQPKDLFRRNSTNILVGGPLVFDIDGELIHKPYSACSLSSRHGLCEKCLFFAKRETQRLCLFLYQWGFKQLEVYFSGHSGFHVYVFDADHLAHTEKIELLKRLGEAKIRIDTDLTLNERAVIGFPSTLNARSRYPLIKVNDLSNFGLGDVASERI